MNPLRCAMILALLGLALSACSVDRLDKNDTNQVMAQTYDLLRQWQRVKRYDCSGSMVSDQMETVTSPTRWVEIVPDSATDLANSSFVNLTNGESARCVTNFTVFQIDYAPGWCNMRVESGLNKIQYTFSYCPVWQTLPSPSGGTSKTCAVPTEVRETGYLYLRVDYREETLDGITMIRPTPEECASRSGY